MTDVLEDRVEALERQLAALTAEVAERRRTPAVGPVAPATSATSVTSFPPPSPGTARTDVTAETDVKAEPAVPHSYPSMSYYRALPMPPARPARKPLDVEELVGGRLLALVGGLAVIVGIAFFVAMAVNHGWINDVARVCLAGGASAALLAVGYWLYERKGRSQAALALVGTAITGMFLSLTAATAGYDLLPMPAALPLAVLIGATATVIAVRWDTRTVAALGIGGALVAPLLGGALTTSGMVFPAVAGAAAAAVLVWRRWHWLALAASALTLIQVALWSVSDPSNGDLIAVLSVFAVLNLGLGLGYELRDRSATMEPSAVLVIPFAALILAALGYVGLPHAPGEVTGGLWLVGLAVAHAAVALLAVALRRVSDDIAMVLFGTAVALGDVSFGILGNGLVLGIGWATSAVGFALVARRHPATSPLMQLTLGGQLALAVGHILLFDAQSRVTGAGETASQGAAMALLAVVVASFASARLLVDERPETRVLLDSLSMAALAYAAAVSFDGTGLLLAWAACALGLLRAAEVLDDRLARTGAIGFLALIIGHVLSIDAPPSALLYGLDTPAAGALGLVLAAGVAAMCARGESATTAEGSWLSPDRERFALGAVVAVALLYLGSTAIVTALPPGPGDVIAGTQGVSQQGQALLSAFWGICGITALWVGLRTKLRVLRLGGLSLLSLAAAKVFLFDLSTLGSVYRVASFIALGLLLLASAFVHQRLRGRSEEQAARQSVA